MSCPVGTVAVVVPVGQQCRAMSRGKCTAPCYFPLLFFTLADKSLCRQLHRIVSHDSLASRGCSRELSFSSLVTLHVMLLLRLVSLNTNGSVWTMGYMSFSVSYLSKVLSVCVRQVALVPRLSSQHRGVFVFLDLCFLFLPPTSFCLDYRR